MLQFPAHFTSAKGRTDVSDVIALGFDEQLFSITNTHEYYIPCCLPHVQSSCEINGTSRSNTQQHCIPLYWPCSNADSNTTALTPRTTVCSLTFNLSKIASSYNPNDFFKNVVIQRVFTKHKSLDEIFHVINLQHIRQHIPPVVYMVGIYTERPSSKHKIGTGHEMHGRKLTLIEAPPFNHHSIGITNPYAASKSHTSHNQHHPITRRKR